MSKIKDIIESLKPFCDYEELTGGGMAFDSLEPKLEAGFTRIGCGNMSLHVDVDPNKDENVIWDYYT